MEHSIVTDIFMGSVLTGIIGFFFWKIRALDSKDTVTREEVEELVKEKVKDKIDPLSTELNKLEMKFDNMQTQFVSFGVTLARIDERMKK